jgi:hypothetical protein
MFRGGDYYDDPKFSDPSYQAKNSLDIGVSIFFSILNEFANRISMALSPSLTITASM